MNDLRQCPFCGCEEADTEEAASYDWRNNMERIKGSEVYAVICPECGAQTGWKGSEQTAIRAWNRREW